MGINSIDERRSVYVKLWKRFFFVDEETRSGHAERHEKRREATETAVR